MTFTALIRLLIYLGQFALVAWIGWSFLTDKQKAQLTNWVSSWILAGLHGATTLLNDAEPYLDPIITAFEAAFLKYGPGFQAKLTGPIGDLAKAQFNSTESLLKTVGESTPDNAVDSAAEALRIAYGFGISSAAVTAAFEAVFPEKLNVLNGTGAMLAQMAGFAEVTGAIRRPLYENAFGKAAEYHYRSVFRPELPSEQDAVRWHSRGLISDDQLRTIFHYSGLKTEYEKPYVDSAYRGVSAFIAARAFESGVLTRTEAEDMMTFYGMRPVDQERIIAAYNELAVQPYEKAALTALETAYERGVVSDADFESGMTTLNVPDAAKGYIRLQVAWRKLEQLAEIYRKSISDDYKYGLITDAQYVPALEAIGIGQADANAHYAVDSAVKHGRELAAAAREAAREAAAVTRAASRAALLNYQEGNIDAVALAAALAVAGVPVAIIPFSVDVAVLRKQASQRMVFGKLVAPRDAVLLREQVAALKEQVIKKLLDTTSARAQLGNLGLPPTNVEDLLAAWAAQALKTVLPVQ